MRVYLSSTSQDLEKHRLVVIGALRLAGHDPICMEHHAAGNVLPKDECSQQVAGCDVYVGVFAWRYGFIPSQCDASITELEYREADRRKMPTLIFLLDERAEWPAEYREAGDAGRRIRELRQELQQSKWVRFFTSPENLATEVLAALTVLASDMMRTEFGKAQAPTQQNKDRLLEELERLLKEKAPPARIEKRQPPERVPIPVPEKLIRHFQDRAAELSALRQCLANRNLRLVLICGRGGMGKTALVAKLLCELMENFREGDPAGAESVHSIVYVPLGEAGYRSPDRIVELISRTLEPDAGRELNETWRQQGTPLRERLAALFRGPLAHCRCVIVLDNLESVLDDENRIPQEFAALRQFVDACVEYDHGALLIATSRRVLTLSPDAEVAAIGRRVQVSLDEGLPEDYAKALLRELDADGRLGLRNAPDDVLTMVARRCRCIPRTLETLVGTLLGRATWNLDTLLANESSFARLVEDPARELYATLAADKDRLVMQALAVYDRPVPRAAVRYMLPALPVDEILDKLVLNFVASHSQGRFWLHPLDRQYAYDQVPEQGSDYSRQALHKLAAEFYGKLQKPVDQWKSIEDLEPQLEEFRHLVRAELYDRACRVLNEIDREHLATWGHSQLIIELRTQLVDRIVDRELAGLNLGNVGAASLESGNPAKAIDYYEQALAIARELGNRADEGRWLGNLGLAHARLGDQVRAIELLTVALGIAREIGDRRHEGRWLGNLTQACLTAGRIDTSKAVEDYQRAIAISREVTDRRFVMNWSSNLGDLYLGMGELDNAKERFATALEAARRIFARRQACRLLLLLGDTCGRQGDTRRQTKYYEQAREMLGEIRSEVDEVNVLLRLAAIYAELAQPQQQLQCYDQALDIAQALGDRLFERRLLLTLGDVYAQLGDRQKQNTCYEQALQVARGARDHADECAALLRLARLLIVLGRTGEASQRFEEALQRAREAGDRASEAVSVSEYANALLNAGDAVQAIAYYKRALVLIAEMNDKASQLVILNRLGMAHEFLNDRASAIEYYQQVLTVARFIADRDQEAIALYNIGGAHHVSGNVVAAVPYFEAALALDQPSTNYKSAASLGIACLQLSRGGEAAAYFQKAIELCQGEPEKTKMLYPRGSTLGLALLALGRLEEALNVYRRGLSTYPSKEDLHWAILDVEMLQLGPQSIAGVAEVISLLQRGLNAGSESVREQRLPGE